MAPALDFETRMSLIDRKRKGPWKRWDPHTQGTRVGKVCAEARQIPGADGGETALVALLTAGRTIAAAARNSSLVTYSILSCHYVSRTQVFRTFSSPSVPLMTA